MFSWVYIPMVFTLSRHVLLKSGSCLYVPELPVSVIFFLVCVLLLRISLLFIRYCATPGAASLMSRHASSPHCETRRVVLFTVMSDVCGVCRVVSQPTRRCRWYYTGPLSRDCCAASRAPSSMQFFVAFSQKWYRVNHNYYSST